MRHTEEETQPFVNQPNQQQALNVPIDDAQIEQSKLNKQFKESLGVIPINLVFAILFLYFSINALTLTECVKLQQVSYFMGLVFLFAVLVRLVFVLLVLCLQKNQPGCLNILYSSYNTAEVILQFVLLIFLIIAYFQFETCGSLHTFVTIYLVIILMGVLMFCCCLCCCAPLILSSAAHGQK